MSDKKAELKERKEIDEKFKWDISSLYESDEKWEEDFKKLKELSKKMYSYKGVVTTTSSKLLEVLKLKDEISRIGQNIYTYAKMKLDEDSRNDNYQTFTDRASSLMVEVEESMSFITPEILLLDENKMNEYLDKEEGMMLYKHYIYDILRKRQHTLSPQEEALIAQTGDMASAAENIFSMLNNADIKFPTIKDENGQDFEVTHGRYIPLMESKDRRVRKDAFKALYGTYYKFRNTFATTLNSHVKKNFFYSKVRKYNSSLEASLDANNIPVDVYKNLIKAVHDNFEYMYKYVKLRKKALGVEELHMYDLYTPIVKDVDMKISYDEAKKLVLDGLKPLGEEYLNVVRHGLESRWVDVYENRGKRSGAYSWGTYDSEPFILLNYQDTLDNAFTLAHELGHSLHSYYSSHNQPYIYGGYSIFVAEVASTVNEALLMNYMLEKSKSKEEKLFLLNHYLEQFRGTIYRQTMFAEFELLIHERVENGEALTADSLSNLYRELNVKYFGPDIVIDDEINMEWARIPHFYYNYYVFQYATGFAAAITLSQKVLKEGEKATEKYLEFLKSGSSDYPINVLKKAGVDMTSTEAINSALKLFGKLVDEMEKLI